MSIIELMGLPFLECLVLVGIHSYLGLHVLHRKVIFVDLAFAQITALGTTVAFLFGLQPEGPGAYVFSLVFAFIASAVFAVTRLREERIPQEAIIGLTYALAAALAILVIDRAPNGAEHIKSIMAGSILWVTASDVAIAAAVYGLVGAFHFVFRKKFFLISTDVEEARRQGINVRLWDMLFYMSFGLIISLSVRTAGVLLVFVFLVVPAMLAMMITARRGLQLAIGWGMGTLVSVAGLGLSNYGDFPSGPAVVAFYGLVLVLSAVIIYAVRGKDKAEKKRRLVRLGGGLLVVGVVVAGVYGLGSLLSTSEYWRWGDDISHLHASTTPVEGEGEENEPPPAAEPACGDVETLKEALAQEKAAKYTPKELLALMGDLDIVDQESVLLAVHDKALLEGAFELTDDEDLLLCLASRLYQVDKHHGLAALVHVLEVADIPITRSDALELIKVEMGQSFGYDPDQEPTETTNATALAAMKTWLDSSVGS